MTDSYFQLSSEYAALLHNEGLIEESKQLKEIINGAFTSTELLMGTRFVLSSIRLDEVSD